jgi:hypothetical protein
MIFPHPLINMQITYLICKLSNWYSYVLDSYANNLSDIHKYLKYMQLIYYSYDLDWYAIDLIIM